MVKLKVIKKRDPPFTPIKVHWDFPADMPLEETRTESERFSLRTKAQLEAQKTKALAKSLCDAKKWEGRDDADQ